MPADATEERCTYLLTFGGEISIKGKKTRKNFVDRLVHNVRDALDGLGVRPEVRREWGRIFVEASSADLAPRLATVFGVASVSRAERRPWSGFDDLVETGAEVFRDAVRDRTFAVRVRRGAQATRIPFRSPEVERAVGARLVDASAGVDLERPEVEARIELHGDDAFFFHHRVAGPGGLPVGTEGRALALLSGGFDSPVAAWSMLRRGLRLDYVFFNLGGDQHRDGVLEVAKVLAARWSWGYRPKLVMIDLRPAVDELKAKTPAPLWQVLLKRRMVRLAAGVAHIYGAQGLVTGEALGQVSSQTLPNLGVIQSVVDLPVLRPLVSFGKVDILAEARRIGTHDPSSKVPEYCGLSDGPGSPGPATHAKAHEVDAAEALLDDGLLSRLLDERAVFDLRSFDLEKARAPNLALDDIPDDAGQAAGPGLLDLRSHGAYQAWHPGGAVHLPYPEALTTFRDLDPHRRWIAYCEVGLKSAHLAEAMTVAGYDARHLEGGFRQVVRWAETTQDPALRAVLSPALLD